MYIPIGIIILFLLFGSNAIVLLAIGALIYYTWPLSFFFVVGLFCIALFARVCDSLHTFFQELTKEKFKKYIYNSLIAIRNSILFCIFYINGALIAFGILPLVLEMSTKEAFLSISTAIISLIIDYVFIKNWNKIFMPFIKD